MNKRPVTPGLPFQVARGETISVGRIRGGLRGYLAIEGGIGDDGPPFAPGPQPLRAGALLWPQDGIERGPAPEMGRTDRNAGDPADIEITAGPHSLPAGLAVEIARETWIVSASLDRIGIRVVPQDGRRLTPPSGADRLPSCGAQFGSIQWHPSGDLMILGPDHPITGGYLQPFTVRRRELWKIGQLTPGQRVRWRLSAVGL